MSAVGRCLFWEASDKFLVGVAMCTCNVRSYITRALYGMYAIKNASVNNIKLSIVVISSRQ